jgi:hypothetical protein
MTDRRKDCIDEILEAIGRRRTRKEVEDHVEQIDERAEEYVAEGMARAEALRRATEETLKEASIRNAIARRNVREDAIKDRTRHQFYDEAAKGGHEWARAIEARLVGSNRPMFDPKSRTGNQLSAAALGLAAKKDWIGGVVTDLERLGRDDPSSRASTRSSTRGRSRTTSSAKSGSSTSAIAASPASPRTSRRWRSPKCCTNGTRSASPR